MVSLLEKSVSLPLSAIRLAINIPHSEQTWYCLISKIKFETNFDIEMLQ